VKNSFFAVAVVNLNRKPHRQSQTGLSQLGQNRFRSIKSVRWPYQVQARCLSEPGLPNRVPVPYRSMGKLALG
jgi:hypothetical protein